MRRGQVINYRKLNAQQTYLLSRIPRAYDMDGYKAPVEPAEVKRARKLVSKWEAYTAKEECQARKRNEALIRKAKEAVYFDTPEKALAIVRQCEKLLKGCPL